MRIEANYASRQWIRRVALPMYTFINLYTYRCIPCTVYVTKHVSRYIYIKLMHFHD